MDYGLVFVAFIAAMAAAHLVVRNWKRLSRRLQGGRPGAAAESSAPGAAPAKYSGWYCFFRPRQFACGPKGACQGQPPRKESRPRPRAVL